MEIASKNVRSRGRQLKFTLLKVVGGAVLGFCLAEAKRVLSGDKAVPVNEYLWLTLAFALSCSVLVWLDGR